MTVDGIILQCGRASYFYAPRTPKLSHWPYLHTWCYSIEDCTRAGERCSPNEDFEVLINIIITHFGAAKLCDWIEALFSLVRLMCWNIATGSLTGWSERRVWVDGGESKANLFQWQKFIDLLSYVFIYRPPPTKKVCSFNCHPLDQYLHRRFIQFEWLSLPWSASVVTI